MSVAYTIREGFAGFKRARLAAWASTSAMVVVLVLIGTFEILFLQGQQVSSWLRQRVGEVELFLEDTNQVQARRLEKQVTALPGVSSTTYISQEQAEKIFTKEFGEGANIFVDEHFLPASIRLRVEPAYANADSLVQLTREFKTWPQVEEVVFNQPLLVKVQQNLKFATAIGLGLGGIIVLAGIFLVANTVRLTIYARRLLIRTMKLVGATDRFIRRPFLIEGVLQGLLAGTVALLLLWGSYQVLQTYFVQLSLVEWPGGSPLTVMGSLVPIGIVLGYIGSRIAARRFIKQVAIS